jgi:hypothetical protein
MAGHAYNPSPWDAEVGGWRLGGQPGLYSKKRKFKKKNRRKRTASAYANTSCFVYLRNEILEGYTRN